MLKEFTGYTARPMERIGYDPELDFETRPPFEQSDESRKRTNIDFDDPEAAKEMYLSGANIAEKEQK